jgi:hypothetical protein
MPPRTENLAAPLPPPTPDLKQLVQFIGREAAFALIEARGGTRFYVPKVPTEGLISLIGEGGARALSEARGGENLKVPLGRHWRILAYHARGLSFAKIARKTGCSENSVWQLINSCGLTRPRERV